MNSSVPAEPRHEGTPAAGVAFDDVLYTLFRHKWLILCFIALGFVGAVVVRFIKPPLYQSEAKISMKYVLQTTGVNTTSPDTQVTSLGFGAQEIMDAEVEIIRSLDTALVVATNVVPGRILAEMGGGNHPLVAAVAVRSGLTVAPPRSATIALTFKHPDETVVQPVLDALIKAYMRRHAEMRTGRGMEEVFAQQSDESGRKIVQMDDDLKKLKFAAGVVDVVESRKSYTTQISKLQQELYDAESNLAQREAIYGEFASNPSNSTASAIPIEEIEEYRETTTQLAELRKRVGKLLVDFTPFHPDVVKGKAKVAALTARKAELEEKYPPIAAIGVVGTIGAGTNATAVDISTSLVDIKTLKRTVESVSNRLAQVKSEAFRLMDFEKQITELERRRTVEQKNFDTIQANLDSARVDDSKSSGRVTGMYLTQSPTPPGLDTKKMFKMIGVAFGGCVGLGIGLAFLIDLVLDRTIRRRADVVRHLHLPVFLTIPDTTWNNRIHFPWLAANGHAKRGSEHSLDNSFDSAPPALAVAEWNPTNHLQSHVEGLRERLITHFEVNSVSHKPKLVAVTACDAGAGVTTLANGLAAALSRTGDGSALLVDMNTAEGRTRSFYKGKSGCGPSEMPEAEGAANGSTGQSLALATISAEQRKHERLAKLLPSSFNHLVPKLDATEYDYIVFDMPHVSPTSATPRLSSQMDIVLMVLESERTGQVPASRAMVLMREAHAAVVAVLNKCRVYIPARLSND